MKLSIITCTYNSDLYLQQCINSVIAQNLPKEMYEHIFVDAYSTDNTKKIIKDYMNKYTNVKIIERKPKWVYNAMNEGIKEAKWEYILCLNSDDFLVDNILTKYLDFIKSTNNKDLYYAKQNNIIEWKALYTLPNNLLCLRKFLFKYFWVVNILIHHSTVLIRRDTICELWLFDESKKIASDYWMWLNVLKTNKEYIFFPNVVSNFRIHEWGISSTKKNQKLWREESLYFKRKHFLLINFYISNMFDYIFKMYWKSFW